MRVEQLKYFVELAKYQSFSLTAKNLHISQPSISQAISNLEDELNVKLFERSRSGVKLTKIGGSLLNKAQSILNLIQDIYDEAQAETDILNGSLKIASIPSMSNAFLSDVLSIYKKKHPNVRIEVNEDGSKQIMQDVITKRVDIGLISSQPGEQLDNRVEFRHLLTGTYMVCIGKNSTVPLYNPMPVEIIAQEPIVTFKENFRQHEYLKKLLNTDHFNIMLTTGQTETTKKLITEGVAIGFYPDFSIMNNAYVQSGDIIPLEIKNNDLILLFGWIRLKNHNMSKASIEFINILKMAIQNQMFSQ
ncbi:LysR family transcriptional regulator [Bacillus sp. IITD106]|nr:LysR family transcriptional regulator [Bacillus sp. IITD106]